MVFAIALEPSNCRTKKKSRKRAFIFSAPDSGMHQTLVQKKSDEWASKDLGVPSMEPYCETKWVEIGENRSGPPGE